MVEFCQKYWQSLQSFNALDDYNFEDFAERVCLVIV